MPVRIKQQVTCSCCFTKMEETRSLLNMGVYDCNIFVKLSVVIWPSCDDLEW